MEENLCSKSQLILFLQFTLRYIHISPGLSAINLLIRMKYELKITCFPQDQHLHNFFHHRQSMEMSEQASEGELVKYLKVCRAPFISNAPGKWNAPFLIHAPSDALLSFHATVDFSLNTSSTSPLESPRNGGSCDGQLSAHNPQPAVLCPNQSHSWGRGCQRYQARRTQTHTHTHMKSLVSRSRTLYDTALK